jgi:hypothetical protein
MLRVVSAEIFVEVLAFLMLTGFSICQVKALQELSLPKLLIPFLSPLILPHGPGSSVGIATGYRLDDPGIESLWGARFSAPVQTGPGAHPASCTMGTGSFLEVKSGGGVTLTPHPLLVLWS